MYNQSAHNTYANNNMLIQSPYKLVELLYEGVLKFNSQSVKAIKKGDIENKVYFVNRTIAIITELINMLDFKNGQVAYYLQGLYSYQITLLSEAVIKNDISKIEENTSVFKVLLSNWREETAPKKLK